MVSMVWVEEDSLNQTVRTRTGQLLILVRGWPEFGQMAVGSSEADSHVPQCSSDGFPPHWKQFRETLRQGVS